MLIGTNMTVFSPGFASYKLNKYAYPDGGSSVLVPNEAKLYDEIHLVSRIRTGEDLTLTLLAINALSLKYPSSSIKLFIPYNSFARQDRVSELGISCGQKMISDALASCSFCDSVEVLFPHSAATFDTKFLSKFYSEAHRLLKCRGLESDFLATHGNTVEKANIIGTDQSATERFGQEATLWGVKYRDNEGHITSYGLHGTFYPHSVVVVLDDIFDGGTTYLALVKQLMETHIDESTQITIIVPHMVASNHDNLNKLMEFKNVVLVTTNSYNPIGLPVWNNLGENRQRVVVVDVDALYKKVVEAVW